MLPMTATPRVPPSSRVASLTAEPTPAFALGTTPMIASVAGALVRPIRARNKPLAAPALRPAWYCSKRIDVLLDTYICSGKKRLWRRERALGRRAQRLRERTGTGTGAGSSVG